MTTFLDHHFKIQEIESRLKKNQYLSNECLPNFIDAQVFKALKASNQIPKRQIHPNFYHWYILMRQFADRTLDYWLKDSHAAHYNDHTIQEVVRLFEMKDSQGKTKSGTQRSQELSKSSNLCENQISQIHNHKEKSDDSIQFHIGYNKLTKVTSLVEKKHSNQDDQVTQYLMSIKVSNDVNIGLENIKKFFDVQKYFSMLILVQSLKLSKHQKNLQDLEINLISESVSRLQSPSAKNQKILSYAVLMYKRSSARNKNETKVYEA